MKISNPLLLAGSLLGASAVAMGAYAEHHLKVALDENAYHSVTVAMQYHLIHAVVILVLAVTQILGDRFNGARRLCYAGWLFVIGTILFSGGIYHVMITGERTFAAAAPAGGMTLIVAWLALASATIQGKNSSI